MKRRLRISRKIVNYRTALTLARETLEARPLSLSLLRQLHTLLMNSVRGQNKSPGEFRKDQNWIGPPGCTQKEATFVPPSPLQLLDHLQAWEKYVRADDVDALVQASIVHAQFEMIHPFKDGNGRIGRLLIPLYLYQKKVLGTPMFYLSEHLELHREDYYARLQGISQRGDWDAWIAFFLTAVAEQAMQNVQKVRQTLDLYEEMKTRIAKITHSQYSIHLLDAIFDRPVFQASHVVKQTGLAKQTVMPLLQRYAGCIYCDCHTRSKRPKTGNFGFSEITEHHRGAKRSAVRHGVSSVSDTSLPCVSYNAVSGTQLLLWLSRPPTTDRASATHPLR